MFHVVYFLGLFLVSLGFPPALLITIPAATLHAVRLLERNAAARETPIDRPDPRTYEKAYNRAIRSF